RPAAAAGARPPAGRPGAVWPVPARLPRASARRPPGRPAAAPRGEDLAPRHARSLAAHRVSAPGVIGRPRLAALRVPWSQLSRPSSHGRIYTMKTTIDSAGRLVIPKAIRRAAGLQPGMALEVRCHEGRVEIEPAALPVKLVQKGRLLVAVPETDGEQ